MQSKTLLLSLFIPVAFSAFSQSSDSTAVQPDTTRHMPFLNGYALVTHNGINLVPTFSLNRPAAMFKFAAGKNRFSFEPEFNFSLAGKPWYFLFWARYKVVDAKRFRLNMAAQYGLNFRVVPVLANGSSYDGVTSDRYIAGEFAPTWWLSRNVSIGIYYIHSHGLDPGTTNSLDFLTLNATWSNIRIANVVRLRITPQFYYLHQDDRSGTYFTSSFAVERSGFPLSVTSIINTPIETNIIGGDRFIWNVTLVYSFSVFPSGKS